MSRLARSSIPVPAGVEVAIAADGAITARGPLGELSLDGSVDLKIERLESAIKVTRVRDSKHARSIEGTYVRRIANLMTGVSQGFERVLELVGVGYRAQVAGDGLQLALGYSNPIKRKIPAGLKVTAASPTEIVIKGTDKAAVGQLAAELRALRPPEPYKGKGVRHRGETVVMKEAKKTK